MLHHGFWESVLGYLAPHGLSDYSYLYQQHYSYFTGTGKRDRQARGHQTMMGLCLQIGMAVEGIVNMKPNHNGFKMYSGATFGEYSRYR